MSDKKNSLSLEERIARLEDVEAIKDLKYRYAGYCDAKFDPDGITSLFTPDGHWKVSGVGGEATGHKEMRAFFTNMAKSIVWAQHFMIAPRIEVAEDGKSAVGRFYVLVLCSIVQTEDPSKKDAVILTGNSIDTFVKVDGRWYFKELTATIHQSSNWTEGWVNQPWRP